MERVRSEAREVAIIWSLTDSPTSSAGEQRSFLFPSLRDIGAVSNTILLPHSPAAVSDLYTQLRNAITVGNLAALSANTIAEEEKKKRDGKQS